MNAIPSNFVTPVIGYNLAAGNFATPASSLPQQIAILSEPNTDIEPNVDYSQGLFVATKDQAGALSGVGSPLHIMFDWLKSLHIPVRWYPQEYSVASAPTDTTHTLTILGTCTERVVHNVKINGRIYAITIEIGDTPTEINQKIRDAVNGIPSAPVLATDSTGDVLYTTKWKGLTSAGLKTGVDDQGKPAGITYSTVIVAGTGTPDIQPALDLFGAVWNTLVVNTYDESAHQILEDFNGKADAAVPVGMWAPTEGRPFIALWGSNLSTLTGIQAITDIAARKEQMTNGSYASPNSEWFPFEAAADAALIYGTIANETPHLGMTKRPLIQSSPAVGGIGDMKTADGRNSIAVVGHSTSEFVDGNFETRDFVTTYHPTGVEPKDMKFRKIRDIMVDMNILYYIKLILARDVQGKVTTDNDTVTNVVDMIKVKDVEAYIEQAIDDLAGLGFIATPDVSKTSLVVSINPSFRFNIAFDYQRTAEVDQGGANATVDLFTTI